MAGTIGARGGGRPRLHHPRQAAVQRGHRDRHLDQIALGQRRQDIDVAHDRPGLGQHGHRMAGPVQHFQKLAHDAEALLDRLIGVGVGADGDGAYLIARPGQLLFQQPGGVGLGEQAALEIQPRRQAHIGMARPGIAVDTAVLAPPVGVDRPVEGQIGRLVARDDAPGRLHGDGAGQRCWRVLQAVPAIVEPFAPQRLEPAGAIRHRAASTSRFGPDLGCSVPFFSAFDHAGRIRKL